MFDLRNVNALDSVTIRGFTICDGLAPDTFGGGIFNHNSVLTVENCYIINNSSTKGGAIYTGGVVGSLTISDCIIANNICASSSGGGSMHINNNTSVTATSCVFRNNSVSSPNMHAGCMYITHCDSDFTHCTFTGNKCTSNGGVGFMTNGVYTTTVNVKDCILRDNEAANLGDNFYVMASPATSTTLNCSYLI